MSMLKVMYKILAKRHFFLYNKNMYLWVLREAKTRVMVKRFLNRECSNHKFGERKSNSVKRVRDMSTWDIVSQNEK